MFEFLSLLASECGLPVKIYRRFKNYFQPKRAILMDVVGCELFWKKSEEDLLTQKITCGPHYVLFSIFLFKRCSWHIEATHDILQEIKCLCHPLSLFSSFLFHWILKWRNETLAQNWKPFFPTKESGLAPWHKRIEIVEIKTMTVSNTHLDLINGHLIIIINTYKTTGILCLKSAQGGSGQDQWTTLGPPTPNVPWSG